MRDQWSQTNQFRARLSFSFVVPPTQPFGEAVQCEFFCSPLAVWLARATPSTCFLHPTIYLSCKARFCQAIRPWIVLEASFDSLIIDIERCPCLSHQLTSVLSRRNRSAVPQLSSPRRIVAPRSRRLHATLGPRFEGKGFRTEPAAVATPKKNDEKRTRALFFGSCGLSVKKWKTISRRSASLFLGETSPYPALALSFSCSLTYSPAIYPSIGSHISASPLSGHQSIYHRRPDLEIKRDASTQCSSSSR